MPKGRSPNCPQMSLREAIEKTRAVYDAEHKHPAERSVIAGHLGYKSLNGASLTALGALRQYGLLEDAEDGMNVSEDAVAVLELHDGEPEHDQALRRLAFRPQLFQELYETFGAKLPSEANLRHSLIKKGFLPKRADEVIRVYRENIELVGAPEERYDSSRREESMAMNEQADRQPDTRQRPRNQAETVQISGLGTGVLVRQDVFSLAEGPVTIQWPASLSSESIQDLGDWLKILERKIKRSVLKSEPEGQ